MSKNKMSLSSGTSKENFVILFYLKTEANILPSCFVSNFKQLDCQIPVPLVSEYDGFLKII